MQRLDSDSYRLPDYLKGVRLNFYSVLIFYRFLSLFWRKKVTKKHSPKKLARLPIDCRAGKGHLQMGLSHSAVFGRFGICVFPFGVGC